MRHLLAKAATIAAVTLAAAAPAHAQFGMDRSPPKNAATPELPRCSTPIGTVAIQEPQRQWWTELGLSSPESLIKLMAARSNCLRVVDRNGGLAMHNTEAGLGNSGELQRGSNVGGGQVRAADYFIIPDIVNSNSNSGGGGGWGGFAAAAGGGYANTDIGKVITAAYFNAFVDLIGHMQQAAPGQAAAAAPIQSYAVTQPIVLRSAPSPTGGPVRNFKVGDPVFPTGQKNGVWWEVDDENGNRGWVSSAMISPRRP